jgi:hypothetical protein
VGDLIGRSASALLNGSRLAVQRSAFSVRRSEFGGKGEQKCVGVSAMGVSAFFNRDRPPRLFSTRTSRTITTRTIPLSQPAFDRQRSTIKIEHENEHDND